MVNLLLSIEGILHLLSCHSNHLHNYILDPLLRLHAHQSDLVANSVNEDILLIKNGVKKLA